MSATKFHTQARNQAKFILLYIAMFKFLDSKPADKIFCTKRLQAFPDPQPLLNFFMNAILFCSQISELFHLFKLFTIYIHFPISFCIVFTRHSFYARNSTILPRIGTAIYWELKLVYISRYKHTATGNPPQTCLRYMIAYKYNYKPSRTPVIGKLRPAGQMRPA